MDAVLNCLNIIFTKELHEVLKIYPTAVTLEEVLPVLSCAVGVQK